MRKSTIPAGAWWALGTALISGVSVYLNKFAVMQMKDPFVFTTLKNTLVALGLLAVVGLTARQREIRGLNGRQRIGLLALGLIGGGIPFLLFFQGLATASAPSAALIHKSLVLWVALLAAPLLGERLGWLQIAGLGTLLLGQLLLGWPKAWGWGSGEILVLIATLLWAVETIVARKVLPAVSAQTGALSRMGVGAIVMWGFLIFSGRAGAALTLSGTQWIWVLLTSVLLSGYVWTWYRALQTAPATVVTSVLTIGAVLTVGLSIVLEGKPTTGLQVAGSALLISGCLLFLWRQLRALPRAEAAA